MSSKSVKLPKDAIVQMLKSLPEDVLRDIFWKAFAEVDTSPLTKSERLALAVAQQEFEKGETVKWEDLR